MEYHVYSISQLDKLQELNHADLKNAQILEELLMMLVLVKFQIKHVFLMELPVSNKMLVLTIRINYHAKEEAQMANVHSLQHQQLLILIMEHANCLDLVKMQIMIKMPVTVNQEHASGHPQQAEQLLQLSVQ